MYFVRLYLYFILLNVVFYSNVTFSFPSSNQNEILVIVSQTAGFVDFYDPVKDLRQGHVKVGFIPHEITISSDHKTAYVSNFGLQDYDETIGIPGNSISVIDIPNKIEKFRLYTSENKNPSDDKAPHGLLLRPHNENLLYVNVEKGNKLLIFDLRLKKIIKSFPVSAETHNFVFSQDGNEIYLMAGSEGIIRINADTGVETGHVKLSTPVHGLKFTPNKQRLMASASNEIALIDPNYLTIKTTFKNLGVDQILYSDMTPDEKYIIAPAVWNNQAIIIEVRSGRVIKRIATGLDPVTAKVSSSGQFAYITNARDNFITQINLKNFQTKNIYVSDGPNGLAVVSNTETMPHQKLNLAVALPLTGKNAKKGRDKMLGYEFWRMEVQHAGGLLVDNIGYDITIYYFDTQSQTEGLLPKLKQFVTENHINMLIPSYVEEVDRLKSSFSSENNLVVVEPKIIKKQVAPDDFSQEFKEYYNLESNLDSKKTYETGLAIKEYISHQNNNKVLEKKRMQVLKKYVELLGRGDDQAIISLFENNAIAISSSGEQDSVKHFYETLLNKTIHAPRSQLINIYKPDKDPNSLTVHFNFSWKNQNDKVVSADFLDIVYFSDDSCKINKLMVFGNTFQKDIMKKLNDESQDSLNNERLKVINNYVDFLGKGQFQNIPLLFTKSAHVISKSNISDTPEHFYNNILANTHAKTQTKILNVLLSKNPSDTYMVYFNFKWVSSDGKFNSENFVDAIFFEKENTKIQKLVVMGIIS